MAHYLLEKLFKKRGIEDSNQLSGQEKQTYDTWQGVLSEGEITVDKLRDFCSQQLSIIDNKMKDVDNSLQRNDRLIVMHNVYKALLDTIEKPKHEKEHLERYLQNLLDSV